MGGLVSWRKFVWEEGWRKNPRREQSFSGFYPEKRMKASWSTTTLKSLLSRFVGIRFVSAWKHRVRYPFIATKYTTRFSEACTLTMHPSSPDSAFSHAQTAWKSDLRVWAISGVGISIVREQTRSWVGWRVEHAPATSTETSDSSDSLVRFSAAVTPGRNDRIGLADTNRFLLRPCVWIEVASRH